MLSMEKDDKINLTKGTGGSTLYVAGLGWDEGQFDVDVFCVLCQSQPDGSSKVIGSPGFIYFRQTDSACGGVKHMGDNLTGAGKGDDEQIFFDVGKLDPKIDRIDLFASIYKAKDRGHKFGMVKNGYVRLGVGKRNPDGSVVTEPGSPNAVIDPVEAKFDLSEDYSSHWSVQVGALYLKDGAWRFHAMGEGLGKVEITDIFEQYQPGVTGR